MTQQKSYSHESIFIQYFNPEMLRLYNVKLDEKYYKKCIEISKIAFLIAESKVVFPVTYLSESKYFIRFLDEIRPCIEDGIVNYISPTSNFQEVKSEKIQEYRKDDVIAERYKNFGIEIDKYSMELLWSQRKRSASKDISDDWRSGIENSSDMWKSIFEKYLKKHKFSSISALERKIYRIPEFLEGTAFVFRFVKDFLPEDITAQNRTILDMQLSKSYLESYLKEENYIILSDTPLGKLDCGISEFRHSRELQKISFERLLRFFKTVKLYEKIQSLNWHQIVELRYFPEFRKMIRTLISNLNNPEMLDNLAIEMNKVIEVNNISAFDLIKMKTEKFLKWTNQDEIIERRDIIKIKEANIQLNERQIFIVHGRDGKVVKEFTSLLKELDIKPILWEDALAELKTSSSYTLDIVKKGLELAHTLVILFTPDERSTLRQELDLSEKDTKEHFQARPNVFFEAGLALALYPARTILVKIGDAEIPSDLSGLNYIDFNASQDSKINLHKRIKNTGCKIEDVNAKFLNEIFSEKFYKDWMRSVK